MNPPAWLTNWLIAILQPLVKTAVEEANTELVADLKAAIGSSEQNVLGAVSGVGIAVGQITGTVTNEIQQVIGAETNAVQQITNQVIAGIKGILPFPL